MSLVGNDITPYPNGRYRLRVYRNHQRHYLGMFPTFDAAFIAREAFLIENEIHPLPPKQYSTTWFKQQSRIQVKLISKKFTNK